MPLENSSHGQKLNQKQPQRKTKLTQVADFETTTKVDDCRVWGWGLARIDYPNDVEIDNDIDSFVERISEDSSITYFHNLKFDAQFIIYWLLTHGYQHTDERGLEPFQFRTLISDMGMFYSMTVRWENGNKTEFRDSLKKLPMTVKRIAKAFKLEEGKGDIDYEIDRPVGHIITAEEEDYIRRDVSIVANAMKEVIDNGMTRLTVASDSLAEYKKLSTQGKFSRYFPVFGSYMDGEIRRAYRGGFTYRDPRTGQLEFSAHNEMNERITRSGIVLDVNSLYPSVMKDRLLPYGEPLFVKGHVETTKSHPLSIFSVTFTAKLKTNHIPCIQIKGHTFFVETEYLTDIKEPVTLMVSNVDWELYNAHYDIDVLAYGGGWLFNAAVGMFDDYIDKWANIKEKATGGQREIAKLHLNSLYGKFASSPNVTSKIPVLKDGVVKYVRGEEEKRPPVYTAVGVFITAFARDLTIRSAQDNYDTFAYADTDSLHLMRDDVPDNIDVHPTRMGAWKFEYAFDAAYYIRPKAYLERHPHCICKPDDMGHAENERCYTNRIAGLPERVSSVLTFDDMIDGKILHGKLTPKAVPGGVVLQDVPFELKL